MACKNCLDDEAKCYNKFVKKFEQFLFYFFLFAIPFQTRKILWHQEWYFNEWQSFSVFGTDILLVALFLFWFLRGVKLKIARYDYFLFSFVLISTISLKNSTSLLLSFFSLLKIIEFVIFYFYIKSYAFGRFGFINSLWAIIFGGLFQAIVAILQFIRQSDLGFRILGESVLGLHLTGIASFYNSAGEKIIRAYGTTPHPNILSAYLLLAVFAFLFLWLYEKDKKQKWLLGFYGVLLFSLFSTFARVTVFVLVLNFFIRFLLIAFKFRKKFFNKKLAQVFAVAILTAVLFSGLFWPEVNSRMKLSPSEEAVQLRVFYAKESLSSGLNFFGVGTGNFINWLMNKEPGLARNLYQPVHNIYLLIYSETGLLGITAFGIFLLFLVKDFVVRTGLDKLYNYSFLLVFLSFLFIGFFDHFLWTLQQGRIVFWLTVSLLTFNLKGDTIREQQ